MGKGKGVLTKVTSYRRVGKKRLTSRSYRRRTRSALLSLARGAVLCNTPEAVDASAALAQVVSMSGMNNRNYLLFLLLLETNHPLVIDVLIGPRNPFLLFSPIKPNWYLLKETFRILAKFKGDELNVNALLALLGVVQLAYKTSKDGYKIYPLRMSDVYSIGKHLDKARDQLDPRNRLLLEILFDIYFVGIDSDNRGAKQIGIKANDIRMAFFDNTKKMLDAIPDVLLVKDLVRAALPPRFYGWEPPPAVVHPLEAREEPELKVGLASTRTEEEKGKTRSRGASKGTGSTRTGSTRGGSTRGGPRRRKPRA
ncbi:MAG TPA: hypothetical protein VFH83_13500 [Spirochaetia bacterium]|nr:hypothetical protein [Spirochaetia bacterium]